MKKILYIMTAVLLCSCGFLDETPQSQLPAEDIVTDDNMLYLNTLGPLYALFGGTDFSQGLAGTYRGVYDLNTITSDEALLPTRSGDWYDGGLWQRLHLHTWNVGEGPIKDTWNYLYKVIVLANQAIEDLSENEVWRQEACALRALFYYELLDLYGNVPLVVSTKVSMADVEQSPRAAVFNFVVDQLEQACEVLPLERSNTYGTYYGRITRPVAWFMLAKLWLNASVYAGVENWSEVVHYCDLLADAGYELESDYASNFAVFNENSLENIFVIPMDKRLYSAQNQYLFRSRHYDHAAACGFTGENGTSATVEVLEANNYRSSNQDPRFDINYWAGQATDLNGNPVEGVVYQPEVIALDVTGRANEKLAGARMKKYELDPSAMKDGKLMDNDWVMFRYADVLLMKAEALLRSGSDAAALMLVNQVRQRAGAALLSSLSLEVLLRERMIEFAWEGWRRQDQIRFGTYTSGWSSRPVLPSEVETGYTALFPIPADILDLNPLLNQNPGY
jgi:hypothetical protein